MVDDPDAVLAQIEKLYSESECKKDYTDGLSISCGTYRFNVRKSNTEPLLRLNVESRGDRRPYGGKDQRDPGSNWWKQKLKCVNYGIKRRAGPHCLARLGRIGPVITTNINRLALGGV